MARQLARPLRRLHYLGGVGQQWQRRIERADYEAQLAQQRYEEVDPSNRLVASTLERRWNDALETLQGLEAQYA